MISLIDNARRRALLLLARARAFPVRFRTVEDQDGCVRARTFTLFFFVNTLNSISCLFVGVCALVLLLACFSYRVCVCMLSSFFSLSFSSSSLPNPGGGRSENGTSRVVAHKNIRNRQLPDLDEQTEENEDNLESLPLGWRSH